jgi:site-specific DNA recombinase
LKDHGKSLVAGDLGIDILSTVGEMILFVLASVAQLEWEAISERNAGAFDTNIRAGKYRGGNPPLGYRAEKVNGEWRYVHDPVLAPLARSIIARVLDGEPIGRIVKDLNGRNVPTPQDYFRLEAGKGCKVNKKTGESMSGRWAVSNLIRQLESETLLGYAMRSPRELDKNGKPLKDGKRIAYGPKSVIYGDDGRPVQRAEPIISLAEFQRLQEALKVRRGTSPKRRMTDTALLLQVIFCGVCGRPMYRLANRPRHYYRCASAAYQSTCGNRSVRLDEMDRLVSDAVLTLLEGQPHVTKVYQPGTDNAAELAELNAELDAAVSLSQVLRGSQLEAAKQRISALYDRKEALESQPLRPAGYRFEPSGQTFREFWEDLDSTGRNQWLRDRDIRVTVTHPKGSDGPRKLDAEFGDIPAMYAAVNPELAQGLAEHGEEARRTMWAAFLDEGAKIPGTEVQGSWRV